MRYKYKFGAIRNTFTNTTSHFNIETTLSTFQRIEYRPLLLM